MGISRVRRFSKYAMKPLLASGTILVLDLLILLVGFESIQTSSLTLLLFFEGGLGLIAGTAIALSSTPSISKIGELTLGTSAWSRESEKHAEGVGWKWVFAATILILIGFLVGSI